MRDVPQPEATPPRRTSRTARPRQGGAGGIGRGQAWQKPAPRRTRLNERPVHIRALLQDREFINVTAFRLPRTMKAQVLNIMERLRQKRMDRKVRPREGTALPEMTDSELLREIKWRVGTLPPGDAEAVARYMRHVTNWYSARRKKLALARRRQGSSSQGRC